MSQLDPCDQEFQKFPGSAVTAAHQTDRLGSSLQTGGSAQCSDGCNSIGSGSGHSLGSDSHLLLLVAKHLAGGLVNQVDPGTGRAGHGFIAVRFGWSLFFGQPNVNVQTGACASKDKIRHFPMFDRAIVGRVDMNQGNLIFGIAPSRKFPRAGRRRWNLCCWAVLSQFILKRLENSMKLYLAVIATAAVLGTALPAGAEEIGVGVGPVGVTVGEGHHDRDVVRDREVVRERDDHRDRDTVIIRKGDHDRDVDHDRSRVIIDHN